MSLAKDLEEIGIFNEVSLTSKGNPVIYHVSDRGRGGSGVHWVLQVVGKTFKSATYWRQCGNLWFDDFQYSKEEGLAKAIATVKEIFPDIEMVKGPWRDTWVCKTDLDAAKERAKEHKKKKESEEDPR